MSWIDEMSELSKQNMQKFGSQLSDWLGWVNKPVSEGGIGGSQNIKNLWGDNAAQGLMSTMLTKTGAMNFLNPYYVKMMTQSAPVMQLFNDMGMIGQGAAPDNANLAQYMVDWVTSGGPGTDSVQGLWRNFYDTATSFAGAEDPNSVLGMYLKNMSPSTLQDMHDAVLSYAYSPGVAQAVSNWMGPQYASIPATLGVDTLTQWRKMLETFGLVPMDMGGSQYTPNPPVYNVYGPNRMTAQ
jgi:hypothetical protein